MSAGLYCLELDFELADAPMRVFHQARNRPADPVVNSGMIGLTMTSPLVRIQAIEGGSTDLIGTPPVSEA